MSAGLIEVGPDRFPVCVQGDGMPVLFVHGAPGDWRTFAPQAAILAGEYRCITYTQRWFGAAEWREDGPPFGTAAHAADLLALAEALDMGKLALVAWSYGVLPAMKAAVDRPDLFSGLFAYEPGFPTWADGPIDFGKFKSDADDAWGPVFAARDSADPDALVRAMYEASGGPGSFDRLDPALAAVARDSRPALRLLLDQTPPVSVGAADLSLLKVPIAIAWGKNTRPLYRIASTSASQCAGGDRIQIEGADHLWPERNPEGFAKVVEYWLRDTVSARTAPLTPAG